MASTKVLVVDDSLTMRALISGALERIPNIEVVGAADGAEEARTMVRTLRPDVLTLDVEMPGMSGIEYLAEIMSTRPMPVIMFSTRTVDGAEDSIEALRLGAIDCFPKPRVAKQSDFDEILGKLGKRLKTAKDAVLRPAAAATGVAVPPIDWNGRPIAVGADAANTQQLFGLFGALPKNCPPVLVVQHLGPGLVESLVRKLAGQISPRVVVANDGMAIEQGTVYFAPQGDQHMVVDSWPNGRLRMIPRDPMGGERPSISLLFASLAKAAPNDVLGVQLAIGGEDGPAGLRALHAAGGRCMAPEGQEILFTRGEQTQRFAADKLAPALLKLCSR